jgi:ABC-type microcin C transport system permease subunit YejB
MVNVVIDIDKGKIMSYVMYAVKMIGVIAFLPFLIPAFFITKMLGGDMFSLDGMGIGFVITVVIAGAFAIGTGFFFLGTLF